MHQYSGVKKGCRPARTSRGYRSTFRVPGVMPVVSNLYLTPPRHRRGVHHPRPTDWRRCRPLVTCSERRAGGSTPSLKDLFLYVSSQENPVKKSGEKTETFSASALAVGTPKACYPSSTQPGPEGVPSQIRAVDRPDSWSLGRLHPPLDGSPTQYICLSFWIFGSSG